jgi:hypothetical protein
VKVHYTFLNTTDHDIDAIVAFPLPELDGGTIWNEPHTIPVANPVNFVAFRVTTNGRAIKPAVEIRAVKNGYDVTARLRALDLPLSVLDPSLNDRFNRLPPSQRTLLEQDGLMIPDQMRRRSGEPLQNVHWPYWNTQIQYHWVQHFPAGKSIALSHRYRPFVGGSYVVAGTNGASSIEPYCGTRDTLDRIEEVESQHPTADPNGIAFFERRLKYILTTAINWKGPIRSFHLSISTDDPDDVLVTCMKGLARRSPTNYVFEGKDFVPTGELEALILQRNTKTDPAGVAAH